VTLPVVKALTVRQPWAWAIVYAGKDVENRRWQTSYRGPLLIHAAKEADPDGASRLLWTMDDPGAFGQPRAAFQTRGAIIGFAYLADILTDSASRWAQSACFHWMLESRAPVDPAVPCTGRPGLWTPPRAAVEAVADWL
jgi:ASCH domain